MDSAYHKGLTLELQLYEVFKSFGYSVNHNVRKTGRSGTVHQIDLYAEHQAPLHTSRLVIEIKAYDKPVDKDRIMKLLQIVEDIGADKGIIITTSSFTPSALQIAGNRNIELWDSSKLSKILEKAKTLAFNQRIAGSPLPCINGVVPRINLDQAKTIIMSLLEERRQGGFLGLGKVEERLENFVLWYYPYYEVQLECILYEQERAGFLNKKEIAKIVHANISVDAVTGEIVNLDKGLIAYSFGALCSLSEEEILVLRSFSKGWFSKERLLSVGYSPSKSEMIFKTLLGKGLIRGEKSGSRYYYRSSLEFPDPQKIRSIGTSCEIKLLNPPIQLFPGGTLKPSEVMRALSNCWPGTTIRKIELLYYPYYVFRLRRLDGSRRVEALDGVTGRINEALSKRIAFS